MKSRNMSGRVVMGSMMLMGLAFLVVGLLLTSALPGWAKGKKKKPMVLPQVFPRPRVPLHRGAKGKKKKPMVLPPDSQPYGKTYGEWGAEWWKWAIAIPPEQNPITDQTGQFGQVGQAGPVWFLAGRSETSKTERTLTVPAGKALFFPIVNAFAGCLAPEERAPFEHVAVVYLGLSPDEAANLPQEQLLRLGLNWYLDHAVSLSVKVDGRALKDLTAYRADSPVFTLTDLDFYGLPGECSPVVADGYWIMLAPLSAGKHTIKFSGKVEAPFSIFGGSTVFELSVTYHLTVTR